jgi:hypothetical protein
MRNEFTAIIERDGKWFVAYCPEVPGQMDRVAPGQQREEALPEQSHQSLKTVALMRCAACRRV